MATVGLTRSGSVLAGLGGDRAFIPVRRMFNGANTRALLAFSSGPRACRGIPARIPGFNAIACGGGSIGIRSSFCLHVPVRIICM